MCRFKDRFTLAHRQGKEDAESLQQAIEWYRRAYNLQPSVFAGINVATLMVVGGATLENQELLSIISTLATDLGRKGHTEDLEDYWDVATLFELSVSDRRKIKIK